MQNEVWILGATGRTARAIAQRLHNTGVPLVLAGRDRERLAGVAAELGGAPRLVVGALESALAELTQDAPGVVVNTIGPFTITAAKAARACPPGTHYVDVSDEFASFEHILALHERAAAANQTFVTGAGFGVLATESVVLRLCAEQPRPTRVRVDSMASVAIEAGMVGAALAGTIMEIAALGGREVQHGRLVRARPAAHPLHITTPDGDVIGTASGATGELLAAWRASNADSVVAASTFAPTNPIVRFVLPAASAALRFRSVRRFATNAMARITLRAQTMPRTASWGHARVEWASGEVREGWLRTGDGMDFTAASVAEVTHRLLKGEGRAGAYTPGALFGPELAETAGGTITINHSARLVGKG